MNLSFSSLPNMPFTSFGDFVQRINKNEITMGVNRSIAIEWIRSGKYLPDLVKHICSILIIVPMIAPIVLLGYSILIGSWVASLLIPAWLVVSFLLHPSVKPYLGEMASYFELGLYSLLFFDLYYGGTWISVAVSVTLITRIAISTIYLIATAQLMEQALKHEDLFCALWSGGYIALFNPDGSVLYHDFTWRTDGMIQQHQQPSSNPV